jgi:CBS domain-containing protein
MATVGQIMSQPVFGCFPDEPAADALEYLQMLNIHAAPVFDEVGRHPLGVVAVSDLLGDLGRDRVRDRMSEPARFVVQGAPVSAAAQMIVETGFHHVVVVDDRQRVVGILSAVDVLRAVLAPPTDTPLVEGLSDLDWTAIERLSDPGASAAPEGPGVLVLLRTDDGHPPTITWAEACEVVRDRVLDLREDPPPRLARLLESDRLRYRAAAVADPSERRRVLQRILAHTAHAHAHEA